jgi:uncharacterized membrane protein YccC
VDRDDSELLPDLDLATALRQRPMGVDSTAQVVRVALAVTASWLAAEAISQSEFALFAPITTLLVVQSSPWTTLGLSVQRILGTGVGVLLASVWVNLVGLTWWSFLIGVTVSLVVARMLPWSIGGQLQIPVAVVFVLALGPGTIEQDLWRVADVFVGGIIGILAVFVVPPRPRLDRLDAALTAYRDGIRDVLVAVAGQVGEHGLAGQAHHRFVAGSRGLRALAETARTELVRCAEASHLNIRARAAGERLEADAALLRRLTGLGIQVRGLVGEADRLYDRELLPPLPPAEVAGLIGQLVDLMSAACGAPGGRVGTPDGAAARRCDAVLRSTLQEAAGRISAAHAAAGGLASVTMIGRLDLIRVQLMGFVPDEG